jgi:hypothetical protein
MQDQRYRPITPDEHEVMLSLGFDYNEIEKVYKLKLGVDCYIPLEEILSKNNGVSVEQIVDNYLKKIKKSMTEKINNSLILNKLAQAKGPENENEKL